MGRLSISGVGCTLVDQLYDNVSFAGENFKKYISQSPGDGGLLTGGLVFTGDLERFAKSPYSDVLNDIIGNRAPDFVNLGGPAVVSILHAGQLLKDAANVRFTAAVGSDKNASRIRQFLEGTCLENAQIVEKKGTTPFTYVLSDPDHDGGQGERTFINNIGAAGNLTPDDLDKGTYNSDLLVLGGTALLPGIHDALDSILKSTARSTFKIVNTVYDFRNEQRNPGKPWPIGQSHESFNDIDLLIMDREEALKISGCKDIEAASRYFLDSPLKRYIITDGTRPVTIGDDTGKNGGRNTQKIDVNQEMISQMQQLGIGDTTGAGDNFAGGVIYSIATQLMRKSDFPDLTEAVGWGIISGSFACTYLGGAFREEFIGQKLQMLSDFYHFYNLKL